MFNKFIAAAALAAISAGASAAGNLVADGSFEDTVVSAGNWTTVDSTDGWQTSNGVEIRDAVAGTAKFGSNFAELDTDGNSSIYQKLNTTKGQQYTLSFWYSDRADTSAATNGLTVLVGSQALSFAGQANATSDNLWHHFSETFTATGKTLLAFSAAGTSDSYGTSLDGISVTAVPEPATFALMAAGLALLGLSRRRQSR